MKKNLIILLLCVLGISANAETYDVIVPSFTYSGGGYSRSINVSVTEQVAQFGEDFLTTGFRRGDIVNIIFDGKMSAVISKIHVALLENYDMTFEQISDMQEVTFETTDVNTSISFEIKPVYSTEISHQYNRYFIEIGYYEDDDDDFNFTFTSCLDIPFEKDGIRYNIINAKEVEVTYRFDAGENLYSGDIVIPSTVTAGNTFTVKSIGMGAFWGTLNLSSVTIPESVISIERDAFAACMGLVSITFPDNLDFSKSGLSFVKDGVRYKVLNGKDEEVVPNGVYFDYEYYDVLYYSGDLIIPSTVQGFGRTFSVISIESDFRYYYEGITSITLPDGIDVSNAGLSFEKDGIRYKVLNAKEVTATYISDSEGNKIYYSGDVIIPSTVSYGNTFNVTAIESYMFQGCSNLTSITIPSSVASIGYGAFSGCTSLTEVTCYAVQPPEINGSFENHNAYLYVPCESRKSYDLHSEWGSFKYIECIGSEEVDLQKDEVVVEPERTAAVFTMPQNESANSYTLTIQNNGVTFCTLTFNAQGQLSNIDFSTTKSYELKASVSAYQFTVTGLSEATDYGYSFKALASNKSVLKEYTGSFTTKNADGTGGSSQGGEEVGGGSGQGGEGGETETKFTVTLSPNNNAYGSVMGGGEYAKGATATIAAIPASDYKFVQWNDGNTDNPRTITVTENCIYVATFEKISTAISEVENATTVTIVNNQILVNGEAPAFVVTISGKKIANQNLKSGVYFVNVEGETVKVVK